MLNLEIITPDKTLFQGEARVVSLPGSDGSFALMNNHAPIISTLGKGVIKITLNSDLVETIEVAGGVVECLKNKVIILAEPVKA